MRAAAQAAKTEGRTLQREARKNPELYVWPSSIRDPHLAVQLLTPGLIQILAAVMSGAFGLAGFYFGRKPTSSTSETKVAIAHGSMPWQTDDVKGGADYKYKFHPSMFFWVPTRGTLF